MKALLFSLCVWFGACAAPVQPVKTPVVTPPPTPVVVTIPAPANYRGLYLMLGQDDSLDKSGAKKNYPAALANPDIDGVYIKAEWNKVEPAKGTFDWSYVSAQIALAKGAHKKVELGVTAGDATPDWVYAEGAQSFATIATESAHGNYCTSIKVPVPYDPIFLREWVALVKAFGATFVNDPNVVMVKITGIATDTDELKIPHETGEGATPGEIAQEGKPCTFANDVANWQKLGYTGAKVAAAYSTMANAFASAFPHQELGIMGSANSSPALDANGKPDPNGGLWLMQQFLNTGEAALGSRFIAAQNGARPDHLDDTIKAWGAAGHPIGWQPSWPINDCFEGGKKVALGTGDCTLQTVIAQLISNELSTSPAYLEFMTVQATALGVSASFAAAHKQLVGGP